MSTRRVITISCLFLVTLGAFAQKGWEAGGWLGTSYYFGDLNTSFNLSTPGIAAGLKGRYNFNPRVAWSFSANYARVNADDARSENPFERQRNLHFRSAVVDATTMVEFNFFPFEHGSYDNFFTPYLGLGISAFRFDPKAEYQDEWVSLAELGTEGQFGSDIYSKFSGAWALAFGFKYNLSYYWSVNFEVSTHLAFTDYLDDVSTVYPSESQLRSNGGQIAVDLSDRSLPNADGMRLGQEGRQRGNSRDNDSYSFVGISLVYWFGQVRCPRENRNQIPKF